MQPALKHRNRQRAGNKKQGIRGKRPIRHLVESKTIRRIGFDEYRQRIQQHYNGPAGAVLKLGSIVSLHDPLAGHLLRSRRFDLKGFKRILDVGSGAGQILRHLLRYADPDAELYCMDLSHAMLRRAAARIHSDRPRALVSDMTRLPFENDHFDCITCGWVLEHLPDPRPGLREMARVLRPEGKLLLLTTEDTLPGAMTSRTWKCRTYNRTELRAAFDDVGLTWNRQLWFTQVHRLLKLGGILVEAGKKTL